MNATVASIATASALLLACAGEDPRGIDLPGMPVTIAEVAVYSDHSGYLEPVRLVIRSQAEWESAWDAIHAGRSEVPSVPSVDFGADMVVLAATGTRASGGYSVALPAAALDGETLRVAVVETTPGDCLVSDAVTQPVAAARVARHEGAVEFVEATVASTCD